MRISCNKYLTRGEVELIKSVASIFSSTHLSFFVVLVFVVLGLSVHFGEELTVRAVALSLCGVTRLFRIVAIFVSDYKQRDVCTVCQLSTQLHWFVIAVKLRQ